MSKKLKVLLVEENKLPKVIEIDNTLSSLQEVVKGYIEYTYMNGIEDATIICNEEGKINGMGPNRDIGNDIVFGPFLIVGDDPNIGENLSLTDNQINKFMEMFNEKSIERTYEKVNKIMNDNYEL